jgi:hypothetical protein
LSRAGRAGGVGGCLIRAPDLGGSGAARSTTGRQRAELSLDYGLALALELPEFRKITGDGRALEARIRQFAAGRRLARLGPAWTGGVRTDRSESRALLGQL